MADAVKRLAVARAERARQSRIRERQEAKALQESLASGGVQSPRSPRSSEVITEFVQLTHFHDAFVEADLDNSGA